MANLRQLLKRATLFRASNEESQRDYGFRFWQRLGIWRRRLKRSLEHGLQASWAATYVRRQGDYIFVPAPLDAHGLSVLLENSRIGDVLAPFVHSGDVALDVGANIGEWTVPLARLTGPTGRVIAFEPNPPAADALRRTVVINRFTHVSVEAIALSRSAGHAGLVVPSGDNEVADRGRARLGPLRGGGPTVIVATDTLDAAVARAGLSRVDFIKLDVEGHEAQIIEGGLGTLRRFRPVLIVETGHDDAAARPQLRERLGGLNYELIGAVHDHGVIATDWDTFIAGRPPLPVGEINNVLLMPA